MNRVSSIKVKNLCRRFGSIKALDEVSFSVLQGEVFGLLGTNGAGKTTCMRILTTLLAPSFGYAEIEGKSPFQDPQEVREKIGFLPEAPPLYTEMKVTDYLTYVARLRGLSKKESTNRLEWVLDKCDLCDVSSRLCGNLSKGYKQRVGIAQSIIHDPAVLFLDEPTSGLDPEQIIGIRQLISSFKTSHTVVLSSHVLPEIEHMCDSLVILSRGKIVASGDLKELAGDGGLEKFFLQSVGIKASSPQMNNTEGEE